MAVQAKSSQRTIKPRKAPFHNKLDSTKDAYIIFSALEYFNAQSQKFTFISENKHEFGSPENLDHIIHPEIIEGFDSAMIVYYRDIIKAIYDFRMQLDISLPQEDNASANKKVATQMVISIDKNKHLLEQLFDYLEAMYDDISQIPAKLLINHYPFNLSVKNDSHSKVFNVYTDNKELIVLLNQFQVSDLRYFVYEFRKHIY